jgi:membrane-associated phospholipid phosphatase
MQRIIYLFVTLIILSIPFSAYSFDIPEQPQTTPVFQPSASQRGVRISTDVLAIALPVATVAGVVATQDWTGFKQGLFTGVTTFGVSYALKLMVNKKRPDGSNSASFPSFHTSNTFAVATFLQRRYGWKFGVPAYAIATYVGWGRIYAKKHDFIDVLAGAAIGVGSALIYTRPFAKKHNLSIAPITDGQNFIVSASFTL